MGQINIEGAKVAKTSEGAPVPYALLFVYHTGTDLLAPIFVDEDLTYSQANPIKADAQAVFADSFVVNGAYRLEVEGPGGEPLATFDGVVVQTETSVQVASIEFHSLSELLADTTLTYTAGSNTSVTVGDCFEVKDRGFRYGVVSSASTTHHLTTAGGVKLNVIRGISEWVSIDAFGAVPGVDSSTAFTTAAESGMPIHIGSAGINKAYEFSTGITLTVPWRGDRKSFNTLGEGAKIKFRGVGTAITTSEGLANVTVQADTAVAGQSGLVVTSTAFGTRFSSLRFEDFDDVTVAFGIKNTVGNYFCDINGIEIRNDNRDGQKAFYVAGLGLPNTNANVFHNVFVTGRFKQYYHIEGNNHIFDCCDANPFHSGVAGGVDYVFNIEGHLNTFKGTYIEPLGTTLPDTVFRFGDDANSNLFERTYFASLKDGGNVDAVTDDSAGGINNRVEVEPIGENFPQGVGSNASRQNLLFNAEFRAVSPTTGLPKGWAQSGTGTIARNTATLRGAPYSMALTVVGSAVTLQQTVVASNPATVNALGTYRAAKFEGHTVTVGVWCWSDTAELGNIKINGGSTTTGTMRHSGSGSWEFLTAQARCDDSLTSVQIQLRTDHQNAARTGTCYFSEPVLVIGGEPPRSAEPRPLNDGEVAMAGRVVQNAIITIPAGTTTPDIADGNVFKTANTALTTITNFDNRHDGGGAQEIKIFVDDANTQIANNGNIRTTTNALKALSQNTVFKLLWNGSRWIEF